MEPEEFAELVTQGNNAKDSLGRPEWRIQDSEMESRRLRRSLYITQDVKAGDIVTELNVRAIRPGDGAKPKFLPEVIGKKFNGDFTIGTPLSLDYISG
jgi:N-acetylneuraminate synthase